MAARVFSALGRAGTKRLRYQGGRRTLSTGDGPNAICQIPLTQPVPWLPKPKFAEVTDHTYETKVTTLENGMRVATENRFGQFCTVGVLLDSGSRYEVPYPSGITHYLEKLAFSATRKYSDRDTILKKLEEHGGICDCQGSRDTLIYAISANSEGLGDVVDLLSEVTYQPLITPDELTDTQMAILFELDALDMRPDPEPLLVELIHAAAYKDNTLGLPKICPEQSTKEITRSIIYSYLQNVHTPERTVLAGVGIDHNQLVDLAKEHFVKKRPLWEVEPEVVDPPLVPDLSQSQYTGGLLQVEKDLSNVSLGPTPMPELAHCVIGLESCSHKDDDFIAFCVLNMMMGGGGSFSAGGPGKGMYTRLYLNVLNRYHWMYNATAYNHAYNDSGMFCIHASAHPTQMKDLVELVVRELVATQYGISESELNRAKTQLQSMLLMNLESRPVVFEDIGRQVLANGYRLPASHYFDSIGRITEEDIQRVAYRMLQSPPAVAALGNLTHMPNYAEIQEALASKDGRMPRRFKLFRS